MDNDLDGRVDALEFIGGVALCCLGTTEEKMKFCFELYDFNLNAALSETEMCMMMQSSVLGMLVLTGGTEEMEPSVQVFETLAKEALLISDSDGSGQITYDEFVSWARSNVKVMGLVETLSKIAADVTVNVEEEDVAEEVENEDFQAFLCGEGAKLDVDVLAEAVHTNSPALVAEIMERRLSGDEEGVGGGNDALREMLTVEKGVSGDISAATTFTDKYAIPLANTTKIGHASIPELPGSPPHQSLARVDPRLQLYQRSDES